MDPCYISPNKIKFVILIYDLVDPVGLSIVLLIVLMLKIMLLLDLPVK